MRTARQRGDEQAIASFERTRKSRSVPMGKKRTTHYGNVIRAFREKAGMDQGEVGRAIGYSTNTISNWENGVSRPDIDAVPALCALLKIPLTEFFGVETDPAASREEALLVRDYRRLGAERRKLAAQWVRQLAKDETALQETLRELTSRLVLPLQPLSAAAGVNIPMEEDRPQRRVLVRDTPLARQADEVFTVNGKSMEPDFPDGCRVFVRHTDQVGVGEVGIFNVGGAPMIKEYQRRGLRSLNRAYPLIRPAQDEPVRCIGKVLGIVPPEEISEPEAPA